ncbi:MAG: efflux RND transporter periplasmic adaptor subunit [Proteobacteria bacterium]|nr:efflux RND transporter periplasmic adaptor subunit [Pseudomonadota bacterium]
MKIRGFILFAFMLMCLTGCNKKVESSGAMSEQTDSTPVETTTVTTSSFTRTRAYVANVGAAKTVKVIPLASERILSYPWENGDFVKQGEMIAEIRNAVSKKGLEAVNAQVRSVDAQLKAAERELKRVQSMYESNIVSAQNLDQARDGVTTLMATKQQLIASQEQARMGLDYAKVVAPIDGVISQKSSEVGDIASSAMPLCVLLDMANLKVTLNVNEEDTPYLHMGQEVSLRFDAFPNEVTLAKVTRIMPYVNPSSRTNTVEAEFENVKLESNGLYKFKPGMYARATLSLETTNDAITVPPKALLLDPELLEKQVPGQSLRRAFILNDDMTVQSREVEIGEYAGDVVEILSGLKPGDKLIVRGQHSLVDGDKVRDVTKSKNDAVAVKTQPVAVEDS